MYGTPNDTAPYCHVGGIRQNDRVKLTAAADMSEAAREKFKDVWGEAFPEVTYFDSSAALLENTPDIVAVCVRGPFHYAVTREVIAAGPKAVFLEKPPTCSLNEMDELRALAKAKNIPIVVSYSRHWAPHVLHMQKLVEDGLIGRVRTVVGYCGGGILSFASHTTDLICQFAGYNATSVTAQAIIPEADEKNSRENYQPEPSLQSMAIEFQNGVAGLQVGQQGEHGQFYVDVFGENGRIRVGMYMQPAAFDKDNKPIELADVPENTSVFNVAYGQIADYLAGGAFPHCADDNFAAVNEIGFAAIESALTGKTIELPNVNRHRLIWANG
jgi:predicted dehydrogenase